MMAQPVPAATASAARPPPEEFIHRKYRLHSDPELERRVQEGTVVVARLHVFKAWRIGLSFARNRSFPCDVVVNSPANRADALHGDVVAVELFPLTDWQTVRTENAKSDDGDAALQDDDVERHQPMPPTLGDGRQIVRLIGKERPEAAVDKVHSEVRIAQEMGGPSHHTWPPGKQPVGRVVAVLERKLQVYHVGSLAPGVTAASAGGAGGYYYRFCLYNPLMPQVVVRRMDIPAPYLDDLGNYLFMLKLARTSDGTDAAIYSGDMRVATVSGALGTADTAEANTAAICSTYGVRPETFADDVEACVPPTLDIPATRDSVELLGRRDLREDEFICTIDPATARDLDDALSVRRLPNGGYHLGVHIADVSYFVKRGTAIDEEALTRLTSVYLVDRVIPMLPRKLSEEHCSLNPSEDKFAFSCLFDLDKDGHVTSEWFGRSVIRSSCRLAYEQAQEIINGDSITLDLSMESARSGKSESKLYEKVCSSVKLLYELASKRRAESLARGRLTIPNTKLGFTFVNKDSKLAPVSFHLQRQIKANWVVEEFMLLANARTAEKIVQYLPDGALLRRHLPPERRKMLALQESLKKCGLTLRGSSAKALQQTLDECASSKFISGISELLKFSLQAAAYFANDVEDTSSRSHFALGLPWYTHFTSPIRRYCDVMVHRQLLVALELEQIMVERGIPLPTRPDLDIERKIGDPVFDASEVVDPTTLENEDCFYTMSEVEKICDEANSAKEEARQAGETSQKLFFCLFLQALLKQAKVDPRINPRQFTEVVVIKMTAASLLLYSSEIASQVQLGLADTKQRFTVVESESEDGKTDDAPARRSANGPLVDGQGREINLKAKEAQRKRGGKQNLKRPGAQSEGRGDRGDGGRNPAPLKPITVSWTHPTTNELVLEDVELFTDLVVELILCKKGGLLTLDMIILPPWEREEYRASGQRIPTSLVAGVQ